MKNYRLDMTTKTLIITKEFEEGLADGNESICAIYARLTKDIKGLTVVRKSHRTQRRYHTKSGEVFNCNQFKNLTYDNMEAFIKALPSNAELIGAFEYLKNEASKVQINGYTIVRKWFAAQFPEFRSNPLRYLYYDAELVDVEAFLDEEKPQKTA